jgi:DUF4097 and DUF4098 domain-containing protein YvlB
MKTNKRTVAFLLTGFLAMFFAGMVQARSDIEENRPMDPEGRVDIDNMAGSIRVSAWDKPEVEIRGELGDKVERLEITETSGGLRIRVHNQQNQRRLDESHLYLQVPVGASIEAESISADISIKGLDNKSIVANTVSGDVDVSVNTGHLEVESVSGDVTFAGESSRASMETVSGEIEAQGLEGEVRFTTVSGDLVMQGGLVSLGRFETVSGDLEVSLQLAEGGRLSADSMSGDVTVVLPANQQAEFRVQTYSGDIRSDFGKVSKESGGHGRSLSHVVGNNGASVSIESFSGDARLKKN